MRYRVLALIPAAAFVAACAGKDRASTASNDDLKRDLELASSPRLELASSGKVGPRTEIVSAIEKISARIPNGRHTPHNAPKPLTPNPKLINNAGAEASPTTVAVVDMPVLKPDAAGHELMPDPNVSGPHDGNLLGAAAGPRPHAPTVPSSMGDFGRGDGEGGGLGGVVVRGAGVDGDHCEPHGRGTLNIGGMSIVIRSNPGYFPIR